MDLFLEGRLNLEVFDRALRRGTHDLAESLLAAAHTQSPTIESTHFLMTLSRISNGVTVAELSRLGLTVDQWETGLGACAETDPQTLPPPQLAPESLHSSGLAALKMAGDLCAANGLAAICETVLLLSSLENATAEVQRLFETAGLDRGAWCERLRDSLRPAVMIEVFNPDAAGSVRMQSFLPRARKVLSLMYREAESLGYKVADPRHLLLALLGQESGVTQYGIHQQGLSPRHIQETVMLSLRSRAARGRTQLAMDRDHLQAILRRLLVVAAELAAKDRLDRIAESHLLRAFLGVPTAARRILEDENVDLDRLLRAAEQIDVSEEHQEREEGDELTIHDVGTVRAMLQEQLVGQDEAVQCILPYIQRMRFGFSLPGRPVGVFLFCGPSGSGKTELAKQLARAVFGSEENLIFLEMGQFNSRESMNIFVGAPPGYVGYGEGKLTNGLRDKPRSVVLFDEVEKAHPLVLDALLRFLDEGRIDDPAGPVRDGSQCIVVLTSNVGADDLAALWREVENNPNWRTLVRQKLRTLFKKHNFRVEFLNRVDELVMFRALGADDYSEISRRFLAKHLRRLRDERGLEVEMEGVCEAIGAYATEVNEGARAAHRLAMSVVITPVIDYILRHDCSPPIKLCVKAERATGDASGEPIGTVRTA